MPGLVPGIHVFLRSTKDVDGRDKPGHDEERINLIHAPHFFSAIRRSLIARLPSRTKVNRAEALRAAAGFVGWGVRCVQSFFIRGCGAA
jgi:hypothetical protein